MNDPLEKAVAEIGVTAFKGRCLELIDDVAKGRKKRVLLTKRGRAVAALVPLEDKTARKRDPWGGLRGTVTIPAGLDLTRPVGEAWSAEVE
ncbi:MAG: type II toxin-antitoxin system Phd/YefM family antitoxin [Alphaproteobacteria bacterium]|nr:type II toxin-antitoxin system Phd/YefM family antitoxin [Alphaproteobacteria bacterium]